MENRTAKKIIPGTRLLRPIYTILPFQKFFRVETLSSVVLLTAAVLSLLLANSPWAGPFSAVWATPISIGIASFEISKPLVLWINEGLMAIFFFLVGLEIKREILVGELASVKKAALPVAAAVGGIIMPAILYAGLNAGTAGVRGWGIPMATDIAFALGVLSLLGGRIPLALKVFLAALAIADDIMATLVIALFYSSDIQWANLIAAAIILLMLVFINRIGVWRPLIYLLLGIGLWLALLKSGLHATLAGILLAAMVPASNNIDADRFLEQGYALLAHFKRNGRTGSHILTNRGQRAAVHALKDACQDVLPALSRLEHELHPWVAFLIMPGFALVNAGVPVPTEIGSALGNPVTLGVILGLLVGKPLGISFFSWLVVRTGLAALPAGVTWRHIYGVSWLGGIGFTMSLFISNLAFAQASEQLLMAKTGILIASLSAAVVGMSILRTTAEREQESYRQSIPQVEDALEI